MDTPIFNWLINQLACSWLTIHFLYLYIFICSAKCYLLCFIIAWSKMVLHRSFAGSHGDSMLMHISGNKILLKRKKYLQFIFCEDIITHKFVKISSLKNYHLYFIVLLRKQWDGWIVLSWSVRNKNEATNEYQCLNQQNFLYFLTCKSTTRGTTGRLMLPFDNVISCFVSLLNSFLFHQAIHICKTSRSVEVE